MTRRQSCTSLLEWQSPACTMHKSLSEMRLRTPAESELAGTLLSLQRCYISFATEVSNISFATEVLNVSFATEVLNFFFARGVERFFCYRSVEHFFCYRGVALSGCFIGTVLD